MASEAVWIEVNVNIIGKVGIATPNTIRLWYEVSWYLMSHLDQLLSFYDPILTPGSDSLAMIIHYLDHPSHMLEAFLAGNFTVVSGFDRKIYGGRAISDIWAGNKY